MKYEEIRSFISSNEPNTCLRYIFKRSKIEFTVRTSKHCKIFLNYYLTTSFMACIDAGQLKVTQFS
jgi:hypothetical protein